MNKMGSMGSTLSVGGMATEETMQSMGGTKSMGSMHITRSISKIGSAMKIYII